MSKNKENKLLNQIKKIVNQSGVSARLVSLWTDVLYTTVSSWNSNNSQPKSENLRDIGELLQIDSRLLFVTENRVNTGLGVALQAELKRLHDSGIDYTIEAKDKDGSKIMANNPVLMDALRAFAKKYKSENTERIYPFYFDMPLDAVKEKDIKKTEYFICKADDASGEFNFLVVSSMDKEKKPVARFNTLDDAQDYVDYMKGF